MVKKYTQKALDNYKKILVAELKRQLNKPNSNLDKSIEARKLRGRDGFGIYMNDYGLNVNQGRSAGELPNMNNLQDWIQRNKTTLGIPDNPLSIRKALFAIATNIKQRGIKPTRFIDIVIDKFEARMTMDLVDAYARDIKEELDKATPNASSKN